MLQRPARLAMFCAAPLFLFLDTSGFARRVGLVMENRKSQANPKTGKQSCSRVIIPQRGRFRFCIFGIVSFRVARRISLCDTSWRTSWRKSLKHSKRSSSSDHFYKKESRINATRNAFSRVGVKIWNGIPATLKKVHKNILKNP